MFFNNKFNSFFGLNLPLVYTFPMCMAWRFHFPIRNYDFKVFDSLSFSFAPISLVSSDITYFDLSRFISISNFIMIQFIPLAFRLVSSSPVVIGRLPIYTIILPISAGVRKRQVAIIARSSREMSLTVRIV